MRERIERRIAELRAEHEKGVTLLANLDSERTNLEQTLLRIAGAVQVLEELRASEASEATEGGGPGGDNN